MALYFYASPEPSEIDWGADGEFAEFVLEVLGDPEKNFGTTLQEEELLYQALKDRRKERKK